MDSRHEIIEEEMLNELIDGINIYILDNLDEIIVRERLINDMKTISRYIYEYAHMKVNVDDFLSKKNFLSIDIVHLPKVNGESVYRPVNSRNDFSKIVENINSVICVNCMEDYYSRRFKDDMQRLISKYKSLSKV